jgi:hypothetical protein
MGGSTMLRLYVQPNCSLRPSRATVHFETDPGKQLEHDWGETVVKPAGRATKVHFQVNKLGYSRRFHPWRTDREDTEHTYGDLSHGLHGWHPFFEASVKTHDGHGITRQLTLMPLRPFPHCTPWSTLRQPNLPVGSPGGPAPGDICPTICTLST